MKPAACIFLVLFSLCEDLSSTNKGIGKQSARVSGVLLVSRCVALLAGSGSGGGGGGYLRLIPPRALWLGLIFKFLADNHVVL